MRCRVLSARGPVSRGEKEKSGPCEEAGQEFLGSGHAVAQSCLILELVN